MLIEILPTIFRSPCSAAEDKEKKYADSTQLICGIFQENLRETFFTLILGEKTR
jgi:hypothetical protein